MAALPEQDEKAERWRRLNRLERVPPPVLVLAGAGAWSEMPDGSRLTTEGEFAQSYERDLRRRVFQHQHFPDDRVVTATVPVPLVMHDSGWGVEPEFTAPDEQRGAKHYHTVLHDEADLDRITLPRLDIDEEGTARTLAAAQELFDGVLEVERTVYWGNNMAMAPMDMLAVWRGFDRLFVDLVDNPEFIHKAMARLVDGHIGMLEQLEEKGLLGPNNRRQDFVGTVAVGYTDELPSPDFDPEHVRPSDLWGTCAAQIFADVSPAMHEEFCLQHERRFLERFGLTCYGCCEPLHKKVGILRKIANLRRIAVTPWADVAEAAEELQDHYVYSWRPNPAVLAADTWQPEAVRRMVREGLEQTRGCIVEIILKDLETCRREPQRLTEWAAICCEEAGAVA